MMGRGRTGRASSGFTQMEQRQPDLTQWQTLVERLYRPTHRVEIAIVGNNRLS